MLSRLCPACGTTEGEFLGSFCKKCFVKNRELYRITPFELTACPSCGRLRLAGEWKSADAFQDFLKQKIRSEHAIKHVRAGFGLDRSNIDCLLCVTLDVQGSQVELEERLHFPLKRELCQSCGRQSGGYYEAVLQVRGPLEKARRKATSLMRALERKTFVARVIEQKNGLDVFVGDKKALFELLQGERYVLSHKLAGMKNGKRLMRASFCLRV